MNPPVGHSARPRRIFSCRHKRALNSVMLGSVDTADGSPENGRLASREQVTGRELRLFRETSAPAFAEEP